MIEIITLPLPSKVLNPNARPNRFAKTAATKAARTLARRETYLRYRDWDFPAGFIITHLKYVAYWKHKGRKRDDVNLQGSCKAYEDGVQDAVNQDDSSWSLLKPEHHFDPDNPRLEIHIHIQEL